MNCYYIKREKNMSLFLKTFSFLCIGFLTINTSSAETVYRFGLPHECQANGICTHARFFTLKSVLNNKNIDFCMYMALDATTKSGITEIRDKDAIGPVTAFVFNLDTPMEYPGNKINSFIQFVEISCRENKMRTYGIAYYPKYFGSGKQIDITTGDNKWSVPNNPLYKAVVDRLCKK